MSHDAAPEDVPHRHPPLHHPNHRHAVPPRPILLRRATTSHLGRQSPGRPQNRVRLSMRRSSDSSRRSDDRYASVIAAVSQARERIRQFEREDESDTHAHARHPPSDSFGISTTINEGNTINLDLGHASTYLPEPRHVPGTPYPQTQQNLYPPGPALPEPQRLPSPSNPQPASAPQVLLNHPTTTSAPPVSTPHQTMAAYSPFANPAQFYQRPPPGPSPFIGHTPLVPIPGLIATPLATSQTLPSSWAPATHQVLSAYVSTPATSSHNLHPVAPGSGMIAWQPLPQMYPGMSAPAFWPTPAAVTPVMPTTPLTPGQALAMPGGLLPGTQPFWTPVESWPPPVRTLPLHLAPWLAPNPVNVDRPHVVWDVSEPPSTAKRLSGKDIFVDMHEAFSSDATAVFPDADEIVVVCDTGLARDMWPPIKIRKNKVTSGDVFWAIYEFFQKPVTCDEVNLIKGRSEDDYRRLLERCYHRCRRTPGLADITRRQGVKRVDCLEDCTAWRGMWPVWAPDGAWSLHLSLMVPPRP